MGRDIPQPYPSVGTAASDGAVDTDTSDVLSTDDDLDETIAFAQAVTA
jgi:hypothetical protein